MRDAERSSEANAGWEYLCRHAAVVVLRVSGDGTVRFANSYAKQLTGLPLEGGSIVELLVPSDNPIDPSRWLSPSVEPRIMNVRVAGGLPQTLYIVATTVGEELLLLGQSAPEEQERMRREVLELNHELTALSRELSLANAELDRLNRLKNQFLGMASHDLRKPTGIILNYAESLLEHEAFPPGTQNNRILERIRSSSEGMARLINDFLDVAIIESGHLHLDLQPIDQLELQREAFALVEPAALRRRVILQSALDESMPRLLVDSAKLVQVFTNLLSNAVEYSPEGGCVKLGSRLQDDCLQFRVEDQGQGMGAEQQQRLFQEFSGSSSLKNNGERSIGLGLVIVRKIVEAHGGTVFVESEPGRGSCFCFSLPLACAAYTTGKRN